MAMVARLRAPGGMHRQLSLDRASAGPRWPHMLRDLGVAHRLQAREDVTFPVWGFAVREPRTSRHNLRHGGYTHQTMPCPSEPQWERVHWLEWWKVEWWRR